MPTYEMPILFRLMNKSENVNALKRVANVIFQTGGFIRALENWGEKDLPCKTSAHGKVHRRACHFFMSFDVPPSALQEISNEYRRDIDIIRAVIYKEGQHTVPNTDCTLEEELLPAPYRPSVQKLLDLAAKQRSKKYEFKYNSGLNYYPFSR